MNSRACEQPNRAKIKARHYINELVSASQTLPSHGENRGSSPLGSANKIEVFAEGGESRPTLKPPFQGGRRWQDCHPISGVSSSRLALSRYAPIAAQGRTDPACRSDCRSHAGDASSGRTAPPIFQSVGFPTGRGEPWPRFALNNLQVACGGPDCAGDPMQVPA